MITSNMADTLEPSQLAEIEEAFSLFDKNRDGKIEASELLVVFKSLGVNVTKEEMDALIQKYDTEGKRGLDLVEFVTICASKLSSKNESRELFGGFTSGELLPLSTLKEAAAKAGVLLTDDEIELLREELGAAEFNETTFAEFLDKFK